VLPGLSDVSVSTFSYTESCSQEAHDAALKHTFPMFSVLVTCEEFLEKLQET